MSNHQESIISPSNTGVVGVEQPEFHKRSQRTDRQFRLTLHDTTICNDEVRKILIDKGLAALKPSANNEDSFISQKPEPSALYYLLKRGTDISVSAFLLLALMPAMAAISLTILAVDGGPVLYHQPRTGKNGRVFRFYKFRSMVRQADDIKKDLFLRNEATGPIFKIREDPRITRVGRILRRFSLDELPQLINVLRGEMSLIGPRPLYTPEAEDCTERQWQRHKIQPGLLCLREICGRSKLTFEQWMELDLLYAQTRSTKTDLIIFLRAIPVILKSDGAY